MTKNVWAGPFAPEAWEAISVHMKLAPRQAEIGYCLFQGMSDKQIAAKVGIKIPTVRTHLERMFHKTGTQDRLEFVLAAMRCYCTKACPKS